MRSIKPLLLDETWTHAGLKCGLRKVRMLPKLTGPYNGYVCVPASHPCAGKHYDQLLDVEVHGGLTFSHVEDDGSTWFGWDDCHAWLCTRPAKEETERLAEQLAAIQEDAERP